MGVRRTWISFVNVICIFCDFYGLFCTCGVYCTSVRPLPHVSCTFPAWSHKITWMNVITTHFLLFRCHWTPSALSFLCITLGTNRERHVRWCIKYDKVRTWRSLGWWMDQTWNFHPGDRSVCPVGNQKYSDVF